MTLWRLCSGESFLSFLQWLQELPFCLFFQKWLPFCQIWCIDARRDKGIDGSLFIHAFMNNYHQFRFLLSSQGSVKISAEPRIKRLLRSSAWSLMWEIRSKPCFDPSWPDKSRKVWWCRYVFTVRIVLWNSTEFGKMVIWRVITKNQNDNFFQLIL